MDTSLLSESTVLFNSPRKSNHFSQSALKFQTPRTSYTWTKDIRINQTSRPKRLLPHTNHTQYKSTLRQVQAAIRQKLSEVSRVNSVFKNCLDNQIQNIISRGGRGSLNNKVLTKRLSQITLTRKLNPLTVQIMRQNETPMSRRKREQQQQLKQQDPFSGNRNPSVF